MKEIGINIGKALAMTKTESLLGGFWFLVSLLLASILSFAWYKAFGIKFTSLIAGISLGLGVAWILYRWNIHIKHLNYLNFYATAFYMFGTLCRQFVEKLYGAKPLTKYSVCFIGFSLISIGAVLMPCNMLKTETMYILPYFIISAIGSIASIVMIDSMKNLKILMPLCKIGNVTMDILIFHFISFKLISVVKILHFNLPWDSLSQFPVIEQHNNYYWILYSIVGVMGSLYLGKMIPYVKTANKKFVTNIVSFTQLFLIHK